MTPTTRSRLPSIVGPLALVAFFTFSAAFAQAQESSITFPIPELGNCGNKAECHTYCDDLEHITECVAFAESHNLMSVDEAKRAREFVQLGGEGPGGCTSKKSCEAYCEDASHMRQCLDFARKSGIMSEKELQEAEKVASYLESGGVMPGGCRGEKECKAYCESGEHAEECVEFATRAGFMSEKEAEIFKKTGGKGPGGCRGRECEAYCQEESHREQCIAFAMDHDLMSEEDKERMAEGTRQAKAALEKAPPAVLSCIEAAIGAEAVERARRGEGFASPKLGQVLPQCFRDTMGSEGRNGPFGPGSAATDCMREVFGDDFEEKMRRGEVDPGAHDNEIRECMQSQMGEGFLNDQGKWEPSENDQPPEDAMRSSMPAHMRDDQYPSGSGQMFDADRRRGYQSQYDGSRAEMEEQMRSGSFNPNTLQHEYRPEGLFPPTESYQYSGESVPQDTLTPDAGSPEASQPTQEETVSPSASLLFPKSGRTAALNPLLANVLSMWTSIFLVR